MKRYLLLIIGACLAVHTALGQASKPTAYGIGFLSSQTKVTHSNGNEVIYTHHGGSILAAPQHTPAFTSPNGLDTAQVYTGVPANLVYFPVVFGKDLFVSKGYFGGYVQLTWDINALGSRIAKFRIFRKIYGQEGDSTLIAVTQPDVYSYRDEFADKGTLYQYTVYAEGIADGLKLPFVNYVEGIGFALPTGTAAGQITYEGGNPVTGVRVVAEAEGSLGGKGISLKNQGYLSVPHEPGSNELELRNGFTFQGWFRAEGASEGVLFSKGNDYQLSYDPSGNGRLRFKVGSAQADLTFKASIDTFFHVSASYQPGGELKMYLHVNEEKIDSVKVAAGTQPAANASNLLIGRNMAGNYFEGHVDELRLWKKPLTYTQIRNNYNRYIVGNEADIAGYWKINAGISDFFFDYSRRGNTFYENHGFLKLGAQWTDTIPFPSQLGYIGVTDRDGNYTIAGFPYETGGSLYRFIPILGVHTFEPAQQIRFIGDGESVQNGVNFTDISSFRVTGTVRYRHSFFPVAGCQLLIDGAIVTDGSGQVEQTDNLGRFEIDVPIGFHTIQVRKTGHTFELSGRFPAPPASAPDSIVLFEFLQPISGIEFIDNTLIKMVGRVVGGPVEGEQPIGFGKSKNNLGTIGLSFTSEKGFDLTESDSSLTYQEEHFKTDISFSTRNFSVTPDSESGEFVAYLPPEKYLVTGGQTGIYPFDQDFFVSIDLTNKFETLPEVVEDTVRVEVGGTPLSGYPPFNPADYDSVFQAASKDTVFTVAVDSFFYQHIQKFVFRNSPTIEVTNEGGGQVFGETSFNYENAILGIQQTVNLVAADNSYLFGHPVFLQLAPYTINVALSEQYEHSMTGEVDVVPVTDGEIEVVNNLSTNPNKIVLPLNQSGRAVYQFAGGFPNVQQDNVNPANSFTKTMSITAFSGNNGSIQTIWREGNPFRGYVFGGYPVGNNFVTTGPQQIITILRDPPGSNSYAYFSEGTSISTIRAWSVTNTFGQELVNTKTFGQITQTVAGAVTPVAFTGTIVEAGFENDLTLGVSAEQAWTKDFEQVSTVTFERSYSTSSDPAFVGADGDVFIGYSTNIVYGLSENLQLIRQTDCTTCGDFSSQGFRVGIEQGLRVTPEYETSFIYSQSFIKNSLIPNLTEVRNTYLNYSTQPDTIPTPSDKLLYISLLPPDDPRFGSANNDKKVWGSDAINSDFVWATGGKSYVIKIPPLWIAESTIGAREIVDSVFFYNRAIKEWKDLLAANERQKVQAQQKENVSIDAGAVYESSVSYDTTTVESRTFEWFVGGVVGFASSAESPIFGFSHEINLTTGETSGDTFGDETAVSTTYGFALEDGDAGDYMSVDVREPTDGFGPTFYLRGGATSCPWEGDVVTEFFQPGTPLADATVKRENPEIEVNNAVVANVADNRAAEFTVIIRNLSETNEDQLYDLTVDDTTNPFGAIISVDGQPIANGRTFLVPAGQQLQKTVTVRKGAEDVFDYPDLKLLVSSQCDENLYDEATISAFFVPGCSDIRLAAPADLWVVNTNTVPETTMTVRINQYNLNFENFQRVAFQYKPSGSSQWITNMNFYNPTTVTPEQFETFQEPKAWITGAEIVYEWDMSSLPDREYDIRAKSICVLGPGVELETPTDVHTGIKDVKRPRLFGSPQPADGILSANDEIAVRFDEEIEAGLLTPFNFSVTGVLNNYEIRNDVSVNFDGQDNYMAINDGLSLGGTSFTIECWLQRDEFDREQVVFSKGNIAGDMLEIGFDAQDRLFVDWGNQQRIVTTKTFDATAGNPANPVFVPDNSWNHYTIAFDASTSRLYAYRSGEYILEQVQITENFSGQGPINIGRGAVSHNRYFNGNIHQLRIWNEFRQIGRVSSLSTRSLTGAEIGLIGLWAMDEGLGNIAFDDARFRHAQVFAEWTVLPKGQAYAFDGTDDYLEINSASTIVIDRDMDFTVEFWFKAPAQTNAVMFSSGKGDGSASDILNAGSWSIGFNANGRLYVANSGTYITLDGDNQNFADDDWHHLALTLNRRGNTTLFIDGVSQKSSSSANFGTLAGSRMWIGARGFKTGSISTSHDHFFKGIIDEFRVWNLQRKRTQIELDINSQVPFDKMGLVAYYPFEKFVTSQGIQQMVPTLDDVWQNPFGNNGGTALAFGNAGYSSEVASIKQARPVSNVDFDYVVNGDEIIITTSSAMAAVIEKSILEITVDRIEDKFENRISSPITWTAFIDQNQLKWGKQSVEIAKPLYDPYSFEVEVVNFSGTDQEFRIENLPSWLSASPASGSLAPLSSAKVTFRVDEGINTGAYRQDLFLSGDFGFDEKLILDLRVFRPLPEDWKVTPSNFQFSMNVIGELRIAGRISTDENDQLGVFVDGQCRGLVNLEYVPAYDNYQAFLTIYSNKVGGEQLEFKIWDDSQGQVYTNVTPNYTFEANRNYGRPAQPVLFEAANRVEADIAVPAGWKWVSFGLFTNELADVNHILKDLTSAEGDQIKGLLHFDQYSEAEGKWLGTITNNGGFRNQEMYKLKVASASKIRYQGEIPTPSQAPVSIVPGWNWIGFVSQRNMEINEALQSLQATDGDIIKSQYQLAVYDKNFGWIGNLSSLIPGEGYMLFAQNARTFAYPNISSLGGRSTEGNDLSYFELGDFTLDPHQFRYQMTLIGHLENYYFGTGQPAERLLGTVDGWIQGVSVPTYNPVTGQYDFFMTVFSNQPQAEVGFTLTDGQGKVIGKVQETVDFADNRNTGSVSAPYPLHLESFAGNNWLQAGNVEVYPNPFGNETNIRFALDEVAEVSIEIFNSIGQRITVLANGTMSKGLQSFRWNGADANGQVSTNGIYFVRVTVNGVASHIKLVKQ